MSEFLFLAGQIARGKSVARATLNWRLSKQTLEGRGLDLGSGGTDQYTEHVPLATGATIERMDLKRGIAVDFENDTLPYEDATYDTVLLLNVLEHLYNYKNILSEIRRIKKHDGVLIGYVPFLMWYHPDHHDYFRYTHETLERILTEVEFTAIEIEKIYKGPYTAAFQMIYPTVPKIIRPFLFACAYNIDFIFRKLRAKGAERYVLGYYFIAH